MQRHGRHNVARNRAEMTVMSQVDHLTLAAHLSQNLERLFGPHFVEGLHDVIGDEGHWRTHLCKLFVSRDAKG